MKTVNIAVMLILAMGTFLSAQPASGANGGNEVTISTKSVEVRDYKSFKKHIEIEQAKLKTIPQTTDNGQVKNKLRKLGIEYDGASRWAQSKDKKRFAFFSPDRKGVVVIESTTRSVSILNTKGETIQTIPMQTPPKGNLGFSATRLFDFTGGFDDYDYGLYIYDFSGKLVKKVSECGLVDAFMVSNGQKYVAVAAELPDGGGRVMLFDMDGNELWRKSVAIGVHSVIQFSRDDKFILIKMPGYIVNPQKTMQNRKFYLYSVEDGRLIEDGNYED